LADMYSLAGMVDSPASLALRSRYDVAGTAGMGGGQGVTWQAGVVDSTAGPIAVGVGMWRHAETATAVGGEMPGWRLPDEDLSNPRQETRVAGALGVTDVARLLSFGVSVTYDYGQSRFGGEGRQVHSAASLAARVADGWRLASGVSGLGLWATEGTEVHTAPTAFLGLGGDLAAGLIVGLDATRALDSEGRMELRAGVEGFVRPELSLRAGSSWDGTDVVLATGVGLGGRGSGWDLGARTVLGELDWGRTEVALGLRMAL